MNETFFRQISNTVTSRLGKIFHKENSKLSRSSRESLAFILKGGIIDVCCSPTWKFIIHCSLSRSQKSSNFLIIPKSFLPIFTLLFWWREFVSIVQRENPWGAVGARARSCKWISLLDLLDTMRTDITNTDEEIRGKGQWMNMCLLQMEYARKF